MSFNFEAAYTFPDDIAHEIALGTVHFPQHYSGAAIFACDLAMQRMVAGEYTWMRLMCGRITDEQVGHTIDVLERAHNAYGIPWHMPDSADEKAFAEAYARVRLVQSGTRRSMAAAISNSFSLLTWDAASTRFQDAFRPDPQHGVMPETLALSSVWSAAAQGLRSDEGQAIGGRIREDIRIIYANDVEPGVKEAVFADLLTTPVALRALVAQSVQAVLPSVRQTLGYATMPSFSESIAQYVVTPHLISRTMASQLAGSSAGSY